MTWIYFLLSLSSLRIIATRKLGYVSEQHMKSWSDVRTKTWDDFPEDIQDSVILCCSLNFTLGEQRDMFGTTSDDLDSYCEQRLEFLMSTVADSIVILDSESRRSDLFVEVLDFERPNRVGSLTDLLRRITQFCAIGSIYD